MCLTWLWNGSSRRMGTGPVQIYWLSLVWQSACLLRMPTPFLCIDSALKAVFARVIKIFLIFCLLNMTFRQENIAFMLHIWMTLSPNAHNWLSVTQIHMSKCHWCVRVEDWKSGKRPRRRTRSIPFITRPSSLISLQRMWTRSASPLQWWITIGKHSLLSDH